MHVLRPGTLVRTAYGLIRYGKLLAIDPRPRDPQAHWEARVLWRDSKDGPMTVSAHALVTDIPIVEHLALLWWLLDLEAA